MGLYAGLILRHSSINKVAQAQQKHHFGNYIINKLRTSSVEWLLLTTKQSFACFSRLFLSVWCQQPKARGLLSVSLHLWIIYTWYLKFPNLLGRKFEIRFRRKLNCMYEHIFKWAINMLIFSYQSVSCIFMHAKINLFTSFNYMILFSTFFLVCYSVIGVKSGDTCFDIANNFKLSSKAFESINPNLNCDKLFVGEWICVKGF